MFSEIVHEDVKMSSDGESDPPSSSDGVQSPVRVRLRNKKISTEVHTHKRTHVQARSGNRCCRCKSPSPLAFFKLGIKLVWSVSTQHRQVHRRQQPQCLSDLWRLRQKLVVAAQSPVRLQLPVIGDLSLIQFYGGMHTVLR